MGSLSGSAIALPRQGRRPGRLDERGADGIATSGTPLGSPRVSFFTTGVTQRSYQRPHASASGLRFECQSS
jgi:hypothetical protein